MVHNRAVAWQTARVKPAYDALAPDGSEIRLLVHTRGGSMVHCQLAPGQVTRAVRHHTVEEVWFCVAGAGELWRRAADHDEVVALEPGTAVSIPTGAEYQFRALDDAALELVITTIPPWPGEDEAIHVDGHWEPAA